METNYQSLQNLSVDLDRELALCEDALKGDAHTLSLLKNDVLTFNRAWVSFASTSVMQHQFLTLKNIVANNDRKMAENFIRFTIYQLEQFTCPENLNSNSDESTGDIILDGRITLYKVFKRFLSYFEN